MDEILDMLVQTIEGSAFPLFYAKSEYRRSQHSAMQEEEWLEELCVRLRHASPPTGAKVHIKH